MECVAVLDLASALGLESVPTDARVLFTRAAMMLSKLEAGPADVVDRGVHIAGLRSHCLKGLGFVEPFVPECDARLLGLSPGYIGTDGFGIGGGIGVGLFRADDPLASHGSGQ